MNEELRKQIYSNLNLKGTDELLEIWQTNDRVEWSDETFDVIRQILTERAIEAPEQDDPLYENERDAEQSENYDFNELELKIIDDENPPEFYDPFEVLKLTQWLDWAIKTVVIVTILYNLARFPAFMNIFGPYIPDRNSLVVYLLAFLAMAINAALGVAITTFILKTLSQLLKITMQMEFNSRKAM